MSPAVLPRRALAALLCLALLITSVAGANSAAATTTTLPTVTSLENTLANAMLALLNLERKANGKSALLGVAALRNSALAHNVDMARYNLMSHQCPGESSPGTRMLQAGYRWRTWGENVGWSTNETVYGIQYMEKLMYGEKAPDNGHRLNILGNFKAVGISVYIDTAHHKMWYTQDFATPY